MQTAHKPRRGFSDPTFAAGGKSDHDLAVEAIVAVMQDYRFRRLKFMKACPESITDESKVPPSLSREAEATDIIDKLFNT